MRYIIRPQKWSAAYPYDEGFAIIDSTSGVQVGWCLHKQRAEELATIDNTQQIEVSQ